MFSANGLGNKQDITDTTRAGFFKIGHEYIIFTTGSTDFTLIGAVDNNPGTVFVATGAGFGNGEARIDHSIYFEQAGENPNPYIITVAVDGVLQTYGVDYTIINETISFNIAPAFNAKISVSARSKTFDAEMPYPDVWGSLVAHENDIVEFDGTNWNVVFDANSHPTLEYVTNAFNGTDVQFKWKADTKEWIRSYEGIYPGGRWDLVL